MNDGAVNPAFGDDRIANARRVEIEGIPVYRGGRLRADDPVFDCLRTAQQFAAFARTLRGPFSIIIRDPQMTTAISDFGACHPIYLIKDRTTGGFALASRIADLMALSTRQLSRQAIYWWCAIGGIGPDPLVADMQLLPSGTIIQIANGREVARASYSHWAGLAFDGPPTYEDAREPFVEIATSYLSAIAKPSGAVACFLSGGTDSAVIARLCQIAGIKVVGLTADYRPARYSEFKPAAHAARVLGIEHQRVPIGYAANRRMFERMCAGDMDVPGAHLQLTSLAVLGEAAMERGLDCWLTGDNAGPIFLEFDHFFTGLPRDEAEYATAAKSMTQADYLARLGNFGRLDQRGARILAAFGLATSDCLAWTKRMTASRNANTALFDEVGYPLAPIIEGQQYTGLTHYNCWLPAQRAVPGNGQVLSPFLDVDMIRFALSLPLDLKYRGGESKWFLREFLRRETGLVVPKIASPNPSRIWWWPPRPDDLPRIDRRLRKPVLQLQASNAATLGRDYSALSSTTALGRWLRTHSLETLAA